MYNYEILNYWNDSDDLYVNYVVENNMTNNEKYIAYSRALNAELKFRGIHVLAVCPFWTKTEFFDRAISKNKKEVVIHYSVMYDASKVMKKAIKDLYNNKKDISVYGFVNNAQMILTKLLPHKIVMKVWMNQQKFDGSDKIR